MWVSPHDRTLTPGELQTAAAGADILVVTAFDRLDAHLKKMQERERNQS